MQDDEFRALMQQLRLGSLPERKHAVYTIASSEHRSAAKFLATRFNYESTRTVRRIISEALLRMGCTGAEAIVYAFDDDHVWDEPDVRERLKELMLQFGVIAVEPLLAMLNDTDWRIRATAAELLGQLGDARAIEPLLLGLTNSTSKMRISSARALAQLKAVQAIEPLQELLNDESENMRKVAKEALEYLQSLR